MTTENQAPEGALTDEQIDAIVTRHFRDKRHPDSYTALRETVRDAIAAQPPALTDEDRTRALNLAYQFRSHPASRGIDDIERAGEIILSLLVATAPQAAPILYGDGIHDDTAALQALVDGEPVIRAAALAPAPAEGDAAKYLIDAAQFTVAPWEPTPWMVAAGESVMMTGGKLVNAYRTMLGSGPLHPAVMADSPFIVGGPQLDVQPKGTEADWRRVVGRMARSLAQCADNADPASHPATMREVATRLSGLLTGVKFPDLAKDQPAADEACQWVNDFFNAKGFYPSPAQCYVAGKTATQAPAPAPEQTPAGYNRPPSGEPCNSEDWNAGYAAGLADGKVATPSAQPKEVQDAAWRKWADAGTVGSLISFLATLDQAEPIVTAYHVTMGNGERRCKTQSLTISRERVDHAASTIRTADTSLPYTHVLWAHPPEVIQAPAVQDGEKHA